MTIWLGESLGELVDRADPYVSIYIYYYYSIYISAITKANDE
jgi:hypothetical protein